MDVYNEFHPFKNHKWHDLKEAHATQKGGETNVRQGRLLKQYR